MPDSNPVVGVSSAASPLPALASEKEIFKVRPNFIIPFSLVLLLWAVGAAFLWLFIKFGIINLIPIISPLTLEIIYIAVFFLVGLIIFLSWLRTAYILTNKRVELHFGIIGQGIISIALGQIENIVLKISFFGLIFNFGNIKIEPAGLTASINFSGISSPKTRKKQIEEARG